MLKIRSLQERLERDEYEVDADKVAEAIVARLLAGRSVLEAGPAPR